MLETQQLRLLQVIAASGSYTAAGRELGLTQPAVTYQMRALERQVGTALTVRRGREMKLTAAGGALLQHADSVLAAVRAAEEDLGSFAGRDAGAVRIVAFPSASATLIADALGSLRATSPDVEVTQLEDEPEPARAAVRRGDADIAVTYRFLFASGRPIGPRAEAPSKLLQIPLLTDRSYVALPVGHAAAAEAEVTVDMLQKDTWLLASERFRWLLAAAADAAGFAPSITAVADNFVSMQALVARGLGVAVIPGLALAAHRHTGVVTRPLVGWPVRSVSIELWPDLLKVPSIGLAVAALSGAALRSRAGDVGHARDAGDAGDAGDVGDVAAVSAVEGRP